MKWCGIYTIILFVTFTGVNYFISAELSQTDMKFELVTSCVNSLICVIHVKGEIVGRLCNVCGGKYISLALSYSR